MSSSEETDEELIKYIDEANDKLWRLVNTSVDFDPEKLAEKLIEKAEQAGYLFGKGCAMLNIGRGLFILRHDPVNSLKMISDAIDIFRKLDNKKWIANAYMIQAIINTTIGNREAALYATLRGIDYYDSHPDDIEDREMAHYVAGTVYKDLGKLEESEKYYRAGLFESPMTSNNWTGRIQTSLSGIYASQGKYHEALELSLKALDRLRSEKNVMGISRALTDVGSIYRKLKKYDQALEYYLEGLALREKNGIKHFAITSLMEIAELYSETGQMPDALDSLLRAEKIATEIKMSTRLSAIYQQLSKIHKLLNQYKEALFYNEKFLEVTLEVTKQESEKRIHDLQNNLLHEKEQEIERLRNVELKNAYEVISEKQKEILDSIHYAKRIQQSLLPNDKMFGSLLNRTKEKK